MPKSSPLFVKSFLVAAATALSLAGSPVSAQSAGAGTNSATNPSDSQLKNQVTRKGNGSTFGGVAGTGLGGNDDGIPMGTAGTGNSVQGPAGQGLNTGSQSSTGASGGQGTTNQSTQ